jgi:tight adherence protein B
MLLVIAIFAALFGASALVVLVVMAPGAQDAKQIRSRLERLRDPRANVSEEAVDVRRVEQLSSIPWLNAILRKLDITERLRLLLNQSGLEWTVGRLLVVSVALACVVGYPVYLRTDAALLSLLMAALAGAAPFAYVLRRRTVRFDRMRQYLPEALDLMVSAIRAGHSLSSAMGMAANESPDPIRREFRQCFDEQNFGLELRQALHNLVHRVPIHDIRIMVTAVLIQSDAGGNLTEILDKVAYLIREDFRLQRQVRTHTAQGRLTGWILSLLPPLLGVLLYLVNPDNMSILWKRSEGRAMLYAGTVMTLVGALIIRKIIRIRI